MKWFGSSKKQIFFEWTEKANKEELKEYVIEEKYPQTNGGKIKRTIAIFCLILLLVGSYAGIIFGAVYFVSYRPFLQNIKEAHTKVGQTICANFGGYIDYDYVGNILYVQCREKSILLDGQKIMEEK